MSESTNEYSHASNLGAIVTKLERIASEGLGLNDAAAAEFAFHMTDWLDDLDRLVELYRDKNPDSEAASNLLIGILNHVPHHIVAAALIATGFATEDVFQLGAVEGDGVAKREPGGEYS